MPFVWLFAVLLISLVTSPARCDDVPPAVTDTATADTETTAKNATAREKERRRKALLGLAGVAGIAITGIALVAAVIVWGGRLRRQNRRTLSATRIQNEYWFLRPPKPPVSDREVGETESAG